MPVQAAPGSPDSDPPNELDAPAPVPNSPAYPGMAPPPPQVPAFRGLLNLGAPQANPGFRGLLNLPLAAPDPGLGSFAADEGDLSPQLGLIAQLAALLGRNGAPNPYFPPPEVLPHAEQSPDSGPLLRDFQRAADEGGEQTGDAAPDWFRESDTFAGGGGDDPMETTGSDRLRPTPPTAGSPEFVEAVDKSPNIGPNAKRAFAETQRWEGNTPDMTNPGNPAYFGVSRKTFNGLKRQGKLPGISPQTDVLDLEPSDVPAVYEANTNDVLQHVGGNAALEQLPFGVAAALHDVLLRDGVPVGVPMIKDAINAGLETQGKPMIDRNNHVLGRYSFDNLESGIATRNGYNAFFTNLKRSRDARHPLDANRNQYFDDLGRDEE